MVQNYKIAYRFWHNPNKACLDIIVSHPIMQIYAFNRETGGAEMLFEIQFQTSNNERGLWYAMRIGDLKIDSYYRNIAIKILTKIGKYFDQNHMGIYMKVSFFRFLKRNNISEIIFDRDHNCFVETQTGGLNHIKTSAKVATSGY